MRWFLLLMIALVAVGGMIALCEDTTFWQDDSSAGVIQPANVQEAATSTAEDVAGVEVACWFPGKRAVHFFRNHKPVRRGVKAVFCGLTNCC